MLKNISEIHCTRKAVFWPAREYICVQIAICKVIKYMNKKNIVNLSSKIERVAGLLRLISDFVAVFFSWRGSIIILDKLIKQIGTTG